MTEYSHAPEPLGVPTRRAAIRLIDAVLRRGESIEAALPAATRMVHGPDRGLAHAIAAETLRRLPDLDALIDGATARPLPPDAKARTALRIALVQALVLGTPPHAAIATVLPLVEGGPRRLVHGVFGTLMRGGATLPTLPALPEAVAERWRAAWGETMVEAAQAAIAAPPPLDLTLADPSATEQWSATLGGTSLMPGHVRLTGDHAPVTELPGFAEGAWWVQDVAASLPARAIGAGRGHALDLCAAPGGKTMQLAAAGWQVTAVDQSNNRLKRLRENLHRTRLKAQVVQVNLLDWAPAAPADAVLIDAPCSATGIFRRHPDVLHRVHPTLVAELAELQARILLRAADWVKPGGTLVYATCSLEPAEGEAQIEALLRDRDNFVLKDDTPGRILPGHIAGGNDGFFIASLARKN
ncbi:rRNA methyltransferase [Sphingomonas metalli]|uniref:rRNA methyltransferase n=1 Tax=Sphingomonas metalli TaxID=1779358 RepID=A0A916SZT9_9SPHN|nr:transcription antitermination factor NusB [Sphingomonas metalli]GGB22091.1 rRNA methyltransferase [Sphingomonas metalli]